MDFLTVVIISMIVAIVGLVVFIILDVLKFKHRVEVREIINGRKIIRHYKARDYVDNDKVNWWKLKGEKRNEFKLLPVPPSESIEINWKGKKCVTVYRDCYGSVKFAKDPTSSLGDVKEYKPLTSSQRVILVNQLRKAESRGGKDWKQNLPMFVVGFQLLIIIVIALVFMEDVAKPFIASKQLQVQQQELMLEQSQVLKDIKSGVQSLGGNVNNAGSGVNSPPD